MNEHEIRADERNEFDKVIAYFKRELWQNNPQDAKTKEVLRVIDALAGEVRANWSLCDSFRRNGVE